MPAIIRSVEFQIPEDALHPFNLDARDFVRQQAGSPGHIVNLVKLREQLSSAQADGTGRLQQSITTRRKRRKQIASSGRGDAACAGVDHTRETCSFLPRLELPDGTSAACQSRLTTNARLQTSGGDPGTREELIKNGQRHGAAMVAGDEARPVPPLEIHYLMNLPELAIEFLGKRPCIVYYTPG